MDAVNEPIVRLCGSTKGACLPTPFKQGIEIYNSTLTKDPKKKIHQTRALNSQLIPCTLEQLLGEVVHIQEHRAKRRSVTQSKLEHALTAINQYAQVIDVLIQQQPDITSLVWGAIRFLIGVAAREIETTEKIADALLEIVNELGRWDKYVELFNESNRVNKTAAHLFSQVIKFLVSARAHYQSHRAIRHVKAGFTTYTQKFDENMRIIRTHAQSLEREVSLAANMKEHEERKAQASHRILQLDEKVKQEAFRQETSAQLQSTLSQVHETAINIRREVLKGDLNECLQWLQQWPSSRPVLPYVEDGTCTWIKRQEKFARWSEESYQKLLCLHGPIGCGKTSMASYLAQGLRMNTSETIVPHFFQRVTDRDRARPTPFVAALLAELIQVAEVKSSIQYPTVIDQIIALSKSNRMIDDNLPFHRFWSIFRDVVKAVAQFTLIVDGLDECEGDSRDDLCLELLKLASQPNTRVIVLFRSNPSLEKIFETAIKIDITPKVTFDDITLFVTAGTRKHPELRRHQQKIIERVPRWCDGMFLLARMMLECLKSAATYNIQLEYLKSCPARIGLFYEALLSERTAQLTEDCLQRRREIFLLLIQIRRAPTCAEVSVILALREDKKQLDKDDELIDPEREISQLCWPLVHVSSDRKKVSLLHESFREYLIQSSSGTTLAIRMRLDDSDAYLARKCLLALSQGENRSPSKISILLRRNVVTSADAGAGADADKDDGGSRADADDDKYFYQYAATHWFVHLFALIEPSVSLVELAARFLSGNEFVSWSEFILQLSGSQGTMLEVEGKLKVWISSLSEEIQDYLSDVVESYFSGPYRAISRVFEEEGGDKTLPFLCLFQLGEFYNLSARLEEAFEVKKTVAEGLVALLGERNPLSLKAESAYAIEYLGQGRMLEAEATFRRLAQIQREVIGTDRPDCYQSIQRQGLAELWMTKFTDADLNLTESLDGFIRTVGVTNFLYLLSQLALGSVLEAQGEWRRATLNFEHVWRYRRRVFGPDNPMAVSARCSMVSSYRKMQRNEEAEAAVDEVIKSRSRSLGDNASPTVDAFIQKLVLYRETGKAAQAKELIDLLVKLAEPWFERVCQVQHVRALLETDEGKFESPRKILQSLIDQSLEIGAKGRNRSLLWVRLDLATILRKYGRGAEALMLFDDIVTSIDSDSSSSWEELHSPVELTIAEKALRLIRDIKLYEAEKLLEMNGLKWVRQEDLWMLAGGPAADTGWMKGPYHEGG